MATYKHLRSSTANKRPTTSITDGQLAINTNTASPGLFFKDSAGTGIVKVGPVHVGTTAPNATPAAGGSAGNYTGEQWLDTSVSPAQMKVWNGSAWVGIVADELPVSKLQDGAARQLLQTDAAGTGVEWTSNVDVPGTLDVTSTATFDSIASHPLGSAGAPTITFTGDTNTGIYSPGADQVAVATNGTGRLFVDASGNVGIANSSPTNARLLVGDDLGAITTAARMVQVGHPSGGMLILGKDNTDYSYFTHEASTQTSNWFYRGGAGITLNSAGLVGIGTSDPTSGTSSYYDDLVVKNATSGTGAGITIQSNSTNGFSGLNLRKADGTDLGKFVAGSSDGKLYIETAGLAAITIDSSQRVGVNTASPGSAFEVKPSASSATLGIQAGTINTDSIRIQAAGTANTYLEYRGYLGHAWFVDATERARIDSSGKLLVGTSSSTGALSNTAPVIAGLFQSFDDVATFTTGVAQTLFVIPNTNATYIVTLRRGSVGDAANYEAVSILSTNSGGSVSAVLTDLKTAANVLISISGTNLQGTQSSGGNASLRWIVTRVG
jgi:hypothetical protein